MVSLPRRRWLLLALLLLVAAIALVIASRMSINTADAHLIWQIYPHDWPNLDAGASAAVRSVLGDFQQVWERRTEIWPLYPMLLNAWALVFGESQLALRLPNILSGLLALAALAHLLKNTPYRLIWLTLVAALFGSLADAAPGTRRPGTRPFSMERTALYPLATGTFTLAVHTLPAADHRYAADRLDRLAGAAGRTGLCRCSLAANGTERKALAVWDDYCTARHGHCAADDEQSAAAAAGLAGYSSLGD